MPISRRQTDKQSRGSRAAVLEKNPAGIREIKPFFCIYSALSFIWRKPTQTIHTHLRTKTFNFSQQTQRDINKQARERTPAQPARVAGYAASRLVFQKAITEVYSRAPCQVSICVQQMKSP